MKKIIKIEGMRCMHCVASVKKALEALGIAAEVSLDDKQAVVSGETMPDDGALREAIEKKGFEVVSITAE